MTQTMDLIEQRLHRHKIKDYEVSILKRSGCNLEYKDLKKSQFEQKDFSGFFIRFQQKQRQVFTYGTDTSVTAIDQLITSSLPILKIVPEDSCLGFLPSQGSYSQQKNYDPSFEALTLAQKHDCLQQLQQAACDHVAQPVSVKNAMLYDEKSDVHIKNSCGVSCQETRTLFYLSAMVVVGDQEPEMGYDQISHTCFDSLDPVALGRKITSQAVVLLNPQVIPNYSGPVIFQNNVVATFLQYLTPSFFAHNIASQKSCLKEQENINYYAQNVTLIDDATMSGYVGSQNFDDEGYPTQKLVLVDQGQIKNFLYNSYWANRLQKKNTGHAVKAGFSEMQEIGPHNFYIVSGQHPLSALLKKMKDGILVTSVIGAHTIDTITGDLSVGVRGVQIKNGFLGQAIKPMVYTGNLHDIMKNVKEAGSDLEFCGRYGASSLWVEKCNLCGE